MISSRVRGLLPAEGGLVVTIGLSRHDFGPGAPASGVSDEAIDLDTICLGSPLPAPNGGVVAVIARTATDLRRATTLAALLPPARQVVIVVVDSTRQRPIGLPRLTSELASLSRLRTYRGSTGDWAMEIALTRSVPAGQLLVATVHGFSPRRPLPLQRVALAGAGAAHWRPGDPDALLSTEAGPVDGAERVPPADLVLRMVDPAPQQWRDPRIKVVDRPLLDRLSWASLVRPGNLAEATNLVGSLGETDCVPPVDEYTVNPIGFLAQGTSGNAELRQAGEGWMIQGEGTSPMTIDPTGNITDVNVAELRRFRAVKVDFGRHTGPVAAVRAVAGLACAGIPLIAPRVPDWAGAIGREIIDLITQVKPNDLKDDLSREIHSIRLRRAALRTHSVRARWLSLAAANGFPAPSRPVISVLLCTMRPDYVPFALAQVARQRRVDLELILTLHKVPAGLPEVQRAVDSFDRPITVVEVQDDVPLGEALNRGAQAAAGRYLTKWDDDDWYSPEHLADLVLAADYSGADLVGSAQQLTYLRQIKLTAFHPRVSSEQFNKHLAGGTLFIDRHVFREMNGFRPIRRSVDSSLQRAVIAAGGQTYRTHGLGYVLHRRESGHTWDAPITHFMRGMTHQWRGFYPGPLIAADDPDWATLPTAETAS